MTVEEYENLCSKEVKRTHLKLYRAPLRFEPSNATINAPVPIDPYYLGLWLGDGAKSHAGIFSNASDRVVGLWLQSYVDRLNSTRPNGARPLCLKERVIYPAGTVIGLHSPAIRRIMIRLNTEFLALNKERVIVGTPS